MKKLLFVCYMLLITSYAAVAQDVLFTMEGQTLNGDWSSVTTFLSNSKPERENYQTCLRQDCTGDYYDGNYQCGECLEYSEVKERINWSTEVQTKFYYKNELKISKSDRYFFLTKKSNASEYEIYADGNLYSQACPTINSCFRNFALFNNNGRDFTIGTIQENLSPEFSIVGSTLSGKMHVTHNGEDLILPATFKVRKNAMNKNAWKASATLMIKEHELENFKSAEKKIIEPTRREKGCFRYDVFQVMDESGKETTSFVFHEVWVLKEAILVDHMQNAPHMKAFA